MFKIWSGSYWTSLVHGGFLSFCFLFVRLHRCTMALGMLFAREEALRLETQGRMKWDGVYLDVFIFQT